MKKFALLLLSLLIIACGEESINEVDQSKIYISLTLQYSLQNNNTSLIAAYSDGGVTGKRIKLSSPASSYVNNEKMDEINDILFDPFGICYHKEKTGIINEAIFTFTDLNSKQYINAVNSLSTIDFNTQMSKSIGRSTDWTVIWDGSSISEGERVELSLSMVDSIKIQSFFIDSVGQNSITIPQSELANMSSGNYKIHLSRSKVFPIQSAPIAGGSIISIMKSKEITVTLH